MPIDFYCQKLSQQPKIRTRNYTDPDRTNCIHSYYHVQTRKPRHKKGVVMWIMGTGRSEFRSLDYAHSRQVPPTNLTVITSSSPPHLGHFYCSGFLFSLPSANSGLTSTWLPQWHHLWPKGRPACVRKCKASPPLRAVARHHLPQGLCPLEQIPLQVTCSAKTWAWEHLHATALDGTTKNTPRSQYGPVSSGPN